MEKSLLVSVVGCIGIGKSTLVKNLGEKHKGSLVYYEEFQNCPFLDDFYADPKKHAIAVQMFMLQQRYEQHMNAIREAWVHRKVVFMDGGYWLDRAYELTNYQVGNITENEHYAYTKLIDVCLRDIPPPNLTIFLHAPVDIILERIASRGRSMESKVSSEYLHLLQKNIEECIDRSGCYYQHHSDHSNLNASTESIFNLIEEFK